MAELESLREIARRMVEEHYQKRGQIPPRRMPFPEQVVEAAIQMESITKDRDFLKRLGIRV